jgi:hypothetical protein
VAFIVYSQFLSCQKVCLFNPTLLDINKEYQPGAADQAETEQEVKRRAVVSRVVDYCAANERPDERTCFANDAEKAEEEKLFASWSHFGNPGNAN